MVRVRLSVFILVIVLAFSTLPTLAHSPNTTQEGIFSVIHAYPQPGSNAIVDNLYLLTFDDGHKLQLDISRSTVQSAGGLTQLKGKRVQVTLDETSARSMNETGGYATATSIQLAGTLDMPRAEGHRDLVIGSQPWASLLCEFPDSIVGQDSDNLHYFQNMYSAQYPGIDHYWREQSYGKVNLEGSKAFGWFKLPKPQNHYFSNPGDLNDVGSGTLSELAKDCIDAANPSVDFSQFVGINLMFNGQLNCCAWGGGDYLTIDGITKNWRLTWNPAWSWRNIHVVAHEVGHGFGLPHSNNYDGDFSTYDNPWDVMSDSWFRCFDPNNPNEDALYGCTGQHTNAYYKHMMGWLDEPRRLVVTQSTGTVRLDHVALQGADDYQLIIIPVAGSSRFYFVEARQTVGSHYDPKLPGKAVLIYEVDDSRVEPAWLVGATTDELSKSVSTGNDAAWLVGETFAGPNFMVSVNEETADGFSVSVMFDQNNLVANGSMEGDTNGDGVPEGWSAKGLRGDKLRCNTAERTFSQAQNCAFQFKGGAGEKSSLSQTVNLATRAFIAGDRILFTAQVNASGAHTNAKLMLKVFYADGTTDKQSVTLGQTFGYQQVEGTLVLRQSAISKIKVQVQNKSAKGKLLVDSVSVRVN